VFGSGLSAGGPATGLDTGARIGPLSSCAARGRPGCAAFRTRPHSDLHESGKASRKNPAPIGREKTVRFLLPLIHPGPAFWGRADHRYKGRRARPQHHARRQAKDSPRVRVDRPREPLDWTKRRPHIGPGEDRQSPIRAEHEQFRHRRSGRQGAVVVTKTEWADA